MKEKIESEIIEVLDTWMAAFNRLDIVAWEENVSFSALPSRFWQHANPQQAG